MTGQEKGDFNRGDCMDRFDFMVQSSGNWSCPIGGVMVVW